MRRITGATKSWAALGALALSLVACGDDGGDDDNEEPPVLPERVQSIVDALDIAMFECPDRAWPNSAVWYRERSQLLLVSAEDDVAYLWNDQSRASGDEPAVSVIDASELEPEWFAFFNVGRIGGVTTVGISLDSTGRINDRLPPGRQDFATTLSFHEGFHFLSEQQAWTRTGGSRATPYPERFEPRYLRAEAIRSAAMAAQNSGPLGAVAHWQQRFASEHSQDAEQIRGTDVIEGSAEYVTLAMTALAELGCDASDEELLRDMASRIVTFASGVSVTADGESYDLGAAAGLALRQRAVPNWEARVAAGEPPLEVLVDGVTAEPVAEDEALRANIEDIVAARNEQNAMEIEPLLERMASNDYYRLALPPSWLSGSFFTRGFLQLVDEPGEPEAILALEASFASTGVDGAEVYVDGQTALSMATPCGDRGDFIVTIAKQNTTNSNGTFSAAGGAVAVSALNAIVETSNGLDWLCPITAEEATLAQPQAPLQETHLLQRHLNQR